MKEKFSVVTSTCVPLPMENVDTDQIIPARFLKVTSREGFGENLFRDWRFDKDGNPVKDFVLNNPVYSGQVLVAGKILVAVRRASMPPGLFMTMVSGLLYRVFLPIFTEITS